MNRLAMIAPDNGAATSPSKPAFDVMAARAQFPILTRQIRNKPLIYFDNAASAQKPLAVLDGMRDQALHAYANVHRGLHLLADETTAAFEAARSKIAHFIGAPQADQVVFTRGATEAFNLLAYGLMGEIKAGDEIILSQLEHHSNIVPWHFLRERLGAVLRFARVDAQSGIDLDHVESLIGPRTKLVSLAHMSNVLGTVADLARIAKAAHDKGALLVVDGAQGAVHLDVDVEALGCDAYVLTGHKLYGPNAIGALWANGELLARLRPFNGGGEMIAIVEEERVTYAEPPHKFEAGTPPILEAIGLGLALDFLGQWDKASIRAHEAALYAHARAGLERLGAVQIFGDCAEKGPILAFNLGAVHAHDLSQVLDQSGVAIRAGHHCAQPLMRALGISACARASFGLYNRIEEVDVFLNALAKAQKLFGAR